MFYLLYMICQNSKNLENKFKNNEQKYCNLINDIPNNFKMNFRSLERSLKTIAIYQ